MRSYAIDRRRRVWNLRFVCVALAALACVAGAARADIVETTDGRRFEGQILSQDDSGLVIDAVVGGVRCKVTLDADEIKSIEKKTVDASFRETKVGDSRRAAKKGDKDKGTQYLVVPIEGAFGQEIFGEGVLNAMSYARQHRIPHVVFTVDSTGGSLDEAAAAYKGLKNLGRFVTCHAIIKNCTGDALVFPIWSDGVFMLPGSHIGGSGQRLSDNSEIAAGEDEFVLRAHIANKVAEEAELRGRPGLIVRAMIDPKVAAAAWKTEDGEVDVAETLPPGTPKERIIFEVGDGAVLVLSRDQAVELGIPEFDGTPADLGRILEIPDWTSAGDYGAKVMERTANRLLKERSDKSRAYERKVSQNLDRREIADAYIQENLQQAAEWDPSKGDYNTYAGRWNWGWGRGRRFGRRDGGGPSRYWTQDSQRRWKDRTDATVYYLSRAAEGIRTMIKLDSEAEKLDLVPSYKPEELDWMLNDVQVKIAYLESNRGRRSD